MGIIKVSVAIPQAVASRMLKNNWTTIDAFWVTEIVRDTIREQMSDSDSDLSQLWDGSENG
jgi:hypothetical protein